MKSIVCAVIGILAFQLQLRATPQTTSRFDVYINGSAYEDRYLYSDASFGTTAGTGLIIGESGVDTNNGRTYIPFSTGAMHDCSSAILYVYVYANANMSGFTADLYGYNNRGSTLVAQTGDYSGGTLLASSVITSSTAVGWVAIDVTSFVAQQIAAGNTALDFKFQVHQSGLPLVDGMQNSFALKAADSGASTTPYLLVTHDVTPLESSINVSVYNSGSVYEDRYLYGDTSFGGTSGTGLIIGESGVDTNDGRSYLPFSISSANVSLIQGSARVMLNVYLYGNAYMSGFTADLYGYNSRGSTLVAQTGDYSGGTLLASSAITSSTAAGWIAIDVTQFAIQQIDAGNTALDFKFQVHQSGLPLVDGKQNTFALKAADAGSSTAPYLSIVRNTADTSSLDGKAMAGYQGWFRTPGDVAGSTSWSHWFNGSTPAVSNEGIDAWPDMSEYTAAEKTAVPGFLYSDGSQAHLYSPQNPRTVVRHFQWMAHAGIDGIWLSQFQAYLQNGAVGSYYPNVKRVMDNVRSAATATGRTWALEYDCTDGSTSTLYNVITTQWQLMVDQGYTSDPNYLHHNGKPVVMLWGFFYNDPTRHALGDLTLGNQLITYFQTPGKYQATLVGGGQWYWRATYSNSSQAFEDMVMRTTAWSPWNVGNFFTDGATGNVKAATSYWAADKAVCDAHGVRYLPPIYPGYDVAGGPTNSPLCPRRGGNFFWEQFAAASALGLNSVWITMFDEVNEGTEIMKITATPPVQTPAFITYEGLPGDWYMRLVEAGEDRLFYGLPITATIPISP